MMPLCSKLWWVTALALALPLPSLAQDVSDHFVRSNGDGTATMVSRPSAGANDGTDIGGSSNGKDAMVLRSGDQSSDGVAEFTNYGDAASAHHWNSDCNFMDAFSVHHFYVEPIRPGSTLVKVEVIFNQSISRSMAYQIDPTTMVIRAIEAPWDEMTITHATQPPLSTTEWASVDITTPTSTGTVFEGEVALDITDLWQAWSEGTLPNYGFAYQRKQLFCENTNANTVVLSDGLVQLERPRLEVTYLYEEPAGPDGGTTGSDGGVADSGSSDAGAEDSLDSGGCGCGATSAGEPFAAGLLLFALLFAGRRRR